MAIENGYTTLAMLKARLRIATADTTDDAELERIITAVSRAIDDYCKRRFYAATETRYYTAGRAGRLMVDDLLSVTTIQTDGDGDRTHETTWAATDYELEPPNAALDGLPYWEIRMAPAGVYSFPSEVRRGVKIIGSFGFAATTPPVIGDACIAQCEIQFGARDSSAGVEGAPNPNPKVSLHPFVQRDVNPYRRIRVG